MPWRWPWCRAGNSADPPASVTLPGGERLYAAGVAQVVSEETARLRARVVELEDLLRAGPRGDLPFYPVINDGLSRYGGRSDVTYIAVPESGMVAMWSAEAKGWRPQFGVQIEITEARGRVYFTTMQGARDQAATVVSNWVSISGNGVKMEHREWASLETAIARELAVVAATARPGPREDEDG